MRRIERIDLLLQREYHDRIERLWTGDVCLSRQDIEDRLRSPQGTPCWMEHENRIRNIDFHEAESSTSHGLPEKLSARFRLNTFERDVILLGLLPHLDTRYQTLLSLLQGKGRQLPTVELALRLFCTSWLEREAAQRSFLPRAPLQAHQLLHPVASKDLAREGWGRMPLCTSLEVWHFLQGNYFQASELESFCRLIEPVEPRFGDARITALVDVLRDALFDTPSRAVVSLCGASESELASALAAFACGALIIDLQRLPPDDEPACAQLFQAMRNVRLHDCAMVVTGLHELAKTRQAVFARFADWSRPFPLPVVCMEERHATSTRLSGMPQIRFDMPPRTTQERALAFAAQTRDPKIDALTLSRRFSFKPEELGDIAREASFYQSRRAPQAGMAQADWTEALRHRARQNFGNLAARVEAQRTLDDLIVTPDMRAQLTEIIAAIRHREALLESGFREKIHYGTGISALFHGPSGTGKTMAAEVLAGQLCTDLIKVDLSSVVNKYIGETEKNLSKIFDMAESDAGVLFFDEADALFGKRSQVKDAHDRHANIEVSYLLQRLEAFPGLVILATNNRGHLDEAFIRRFTFVTRFVYPDVALREAMWKAIWPKQMKVDDSIDFGDLARRIDVTGASIRNIALLAGWLSMSEGSSAVMSHHIEQASVRELAKSGRLNI
jgi:hypothetical protein